MVIEWIDQEHYVHGCYASTPTGYTSVEHIHAETEEELEKTVTKLTQKYPIVVILSRAKSLRGILDAI